MTYSSPLSILHGPTNVGGHASNLAEAERKLGFNSHLLSLYDNYIHYEADECWNLENKNIIGKVFGHLRAAIKARSYDILHFNYGSTFVHFLNRGIINLDLPLYTNHQKLFFTFNGCDIRQKYPTILRRNSENEPAACFNSDCYNGMCNSGIMDKNRRKSIDKIIDKTNHIFALNPDLMYFLPKEKTSFLPYAIKGLGNNIKRKRAFFHKDKVRIVHAPTNRGAKGTELILKTLNNLKEKIPNKIDIILIENMSHKLALEAYCNADLIVDQTLIGWYGGLAVEAMQMGVPVASYINQTDLKFVPTAMIEDLPILQIHPLTLENNLLSIIENREHLIKQGQIAKAWVNKWHDPIEVAKITTKAYMN